MDTTVQMSRMRFGRRRPWSHHDRAATLVRHALSAVVIALAFWATFVDDRLGSPRFTSGANGQTVVATVSVGGEWWALGIRPGMPATPWPSEAAEPLGYDVALDGATVAIATTASPSLQGGVMVGSIVLAVAVGLAMLRMPGSVVAQVIAVSLCLISVHVRFGLPATLPLMLLPPTIATLAVPFGLATTKRALFVPAAAIGASLLLGLWLTSAPAVDWSLMWLLPGILGVVVVASSVAIRLAGPGEPRSALRRLIPAVGESHLAGREAERRKVAGEVHDEILPQLRRSLTDIEKADRNVTIEGLHELTESIRGLMNDRQLVVLEAAGLHVALENYAMGLSRRGMAVDVELLGNPGHRPPLEIEVALYRIAQAAIDNAARHAGAARVNVVIRADHDAVALVVMDDGRGIEPARLRDAVKQGHLGVAEMTQRAAQFGATLEITTQEVGTRVRVLWRR